MRFLIAVLLLTLPAFAADVHCGASSSGSGDGSDWSNRCDFDTVTPVRGNTYYLADGTYASKNLTTANSGTTLITVRKATVASHGSATGWSDGDGDGYAQFSDINFDSDYWVLTGVFRNESDWSQQNSYGIRVLGSIHTYIDALVRCSSHITISYVDSGGAYGSSYTGSEPDDAFKVSCFTGGYSEDITIQNSWFHNIGHYALLHMNGLDQCLIENNYIGPGWGKEGIRGQIALKNCTIRYNKFINSCGPAPPDGCTAPIASWDGNTNGFDNALIYGNLFVQTNSDEYSGGTIVVGGNGGSWAGPSASGVLIYNNTIAGVEGGASGCNILINGGTGNEVRNTLWYDCVGTPSATPNTSNNGEESTDPFVNYAGGDFHLTAAIAGTSLSSPYNEDMDGVTRGADGTFDRGAFELDEGGDVTPPSRSAGAPSGTIAYTTSTTLSLTTDESATCKWDADASTAYASMSDTFSSTGSTSHSTTANVSVGSNTFYVRCTDGTNANTDDYSITFTVAAQSTTTSGIGGGVTIPGGSTIP